MQTHTNNLNINNLITHARCSFSFAALVAVAYSVIVATASSYIIKCLGNHLMPGLTVDCRMAVSVSRVCWLRTTSPSQPHTRFKRRRGITCVCSWPQSQLNNLALRRPTDVAVCGWPVSSPQFTAFLYTILSAMLISRQWLSRRQEHFGATQSKTCSLKIYFVKNSFSNSSNFYPSFDINESVRS